MTRGQTVLEVLNRYMPLTFLLDVMDLVNVLYMFSWDCVVHCACSTGKNTFSTSCCTAATRWMDECSA